MPFSNCRLWICEVLINFFSKIGFPERQRDGIFIRNPIRRPRKYTWTWCNTRRPASPARRRLRRESGTRQCNRIILNKCPISQFLLSPPNRGHAQHQNRENLQPANKHQHAHDDFREGRINREILHRADEVKARPYVVECRHQGREGGKAVKSIQR